MALSVEDGTGIEGADSYVTLDEAKAYAAKRGLDVPDDAALEVLLVKATDYIESRRFVGAKVNGQGFLSWPRTGVILDDEEITGIPEALKRAQIQLAVEMQAVDPHATVSTSAVKSKTVGPLTTVYAVADGDRPATRLPKVDRLLAPLLVTFAVTTERA